jgi:hypothetical protein
MMYGLDDDIEQRPNQRALIQQLGGGSNIAQMGPGAGRPDALSPDAATASAWRNDPSNPLRGMMQKLAPTQGDYAKHYADGTRAGQDMSWMQAQGIAPGEPAPGSKPQGFSSQNPNGRGYLEEATRWYAPQLQAMTDEGQREQAVESFLRSLAPELQSRGLNVGDIKKEKMQIDGKWVDLYRDITNGRGSGAAEAQWLEDNGSGTGLPMQGGGSMARGNLNALLTGDPMAGIQAALGKYSEQGDNLQALLAQLGVQNG